MTIWSSAEDEAKRLIQEQDEERRLDTDNNLIRQSYIYLHGLCGEKYWRQIINGEKFVKVTPTVGVGIHGGASCDNIQKKNNDQEFSPTVVGDYSVAVYDSRFKEGEVIETKAEIDAGRDKTFQGGKNWKILVSPLITRPDEVEVKINAPVQGTELVIQGTLDLVEHGNVVDLKTSNRKWPADKVHHSTQLSTYAFLYKSLYGKLPESVVVDNLVSTKKGWATYRLWSDRTEEDILAWWQRVVQFRKALEAGYFPPAQEGSWICSPKWCEFWESCKYVTSARRHAAKQMEGE